MTKLKKIKVKVMFVQKWYSIFYCFCIIENFTSFQIDTVHRQFFQ